MTYGEIIKELADGKTLARKGWPGGSFIVRQIPQTIGLDVIPRMTSLPDMAKTHLKQHESSISYHDQILRVDVNFGKSYATYYIPSWEDMFADDWYIVLPMEVVDIDDKPNHIKIDIIEGAAGQGKSTKMIEQAAKYAKVDGRTVCYITFEDTAQTIVRRYVYALIGRNDVKFEDLSFDEKNLCEELRDYIDVYQMTPINDNLDDIYRFLRVLGKKYDVICIDPLDYLLYDRSGTEILESLKQYASEKGVKIVATRQLSNGPANDKEAFPYYTDDFNVINVNKE